MRRHPHRHGSPETLHDAVYVGDLGAVATLLNQGTPVDAPGEDGATALLDSVRYNHLHVLRLLRGLGADPNVPGPEGITALHMAIGLAREDHLDDLLERAYNAGPPVNLHAVDANGDTALHHLARALNKGKCPEAYRVQRRDTWWDEVAERLIAAGIDPLRVNHQGQNALDQVEQPGRVPRWHQATVAAEQGALNRILGGHPPSSDAPSRHRL